MNKHAVFLAVFLIPLAADARGVRMYPFRGGDGVLDAGGKPMLGCEPIVDRNHDHVRFVGEIAAHVVVALEVADHPAATVKLHQNGKQRVAGLTRAASAIPRTRVPVSPRFANCSSAASRIRASVASDRLRATAACDTGASRAE